MRLLIVGNPQPTHLGGHFLSGAQPLGVDAELLDLSKAYAGPKLWRSLLWHLAGHRPAKLKTFGRSVVAWCQVHKPQLVLTTGIAPIVKEHLLAIKATGAKLANFLTDDPWNPAHRAPWFMHSLPVYDHVFTPRRANMNELMSCCTQVEYLPFGYDPVMHAPPPAMTPEQQAQMQSDVLFIGGADDDRVRVMRHLHAAGLRLSLWGGYWDLDPVLKASAHGHANPEQVRQLVPLAGINLCLVRRANRDGHSMRSYELPAIGGCLLVEHTAEHEAMFGKDGECVRCFHNQDNMVQVAHEMLAQKNERTRMAVAVRERICVQHSNRYTDRIQFIIDRVFS